VRLRAAAAAAPASASASVTESDLALKVLYVEDNPVNLLLVRELLALRP
jgi:hypothetical protein